MIIEFTVGTNNVDCQQFANVWNWSTITTVVPQDAVSVSLITRRVLLTDLSTRVNLLDHEFKVNLIGNHEHRVRI